MLWLFSPLLDCGRGYTLMHSRYSLAPLIHVLIIESAAAKAEDQREERRSVGYPALIL
jgi:hypothetical protein